MKFISIILLAFICSLQTVNAQINIDSLRQQYNEKNDQLYYLNKDNTKFTGIAISKTYGYIDTKYTIKNGLINGKVYEYFEDGKTQSITDYKNNLPHGNYIEYNTKGKLIMQQKYKNGEKVGNWKSSYEKYLSDTLLNNKVYSKIELYNDKISIKPVLTRRGWVGLNISYTGNMFLVTDTINWRVNELDTCIVITNICDTTKYAECHIADTLVPLKILAKNDNIYTELYLINAGKPIYIIMHYTLDPNDYLYQKQKTQPGKYINYMWGGTLGGANRHYYYFKKLE